MKLQRDKLKQYKKKIEIIADQEQNIAKDALSKGNKSKALLALRRKKYQESLLIKTDQQLETLQNLVSSVEFSLIEKDVLFGLQQGNQVLKEIHKEMNIESVEKLMSETTEAIAYQREIDELMMSKMTVEEEEEVQRELALLQAQELPTQNSEVEVHPSITIDLPDAPTTRLPELSDPVLNQVKSQSKPLKEPEALPA
ncbi:Snf7 family [Melampsora americana]|nr:Snf7 family [Melampsora americana]